MPSSVIAAMSYNAATQTLTRVYRGKRGVYRYFEVPPEEYAAFCAIQRHLSERSLQNQAVPVRASEQDLAGFILPALPSE
jgi:hypothetical protein